MRAFAVILLNNLRRLFEHKPRFFLFIILSAGALAAAIFINTRAELVGHIAVVSRSEIMLPSEHFRISRLDEAPLLSELVAGKYDAAVIFDDEGGYEIRTIKSEDFQQKLDLVLADPSQITAAVKGARGAGTNILGFMMMFIMMQGVSLAFLFAEDKEKKQLRRIASSPVPFTGYLCAHGIFVFALLLIPVMVILAIAQLLPGVEIGFGLPMYLALSSLICFLSAGFGLFLTAMIKSGDLANMAGSAIVVLTSVLAGSFYSFDKGNKVLETVIKVLPQRAFLSLAESLEKGMGISSWLSNGLYIIALITAFIMIAVVKTRRDYLKN
ncbi:MAG: ABC transporter permease [Clostridiales bacterium]|jgi:ABC-2 type transport system permease protein|nr:ABC transporter permease [Clostridiales bacterium]